MTIEKFFEDSNCRIGGEEKKDIDPLLRHITDLLIYENLPGTLMEKVAKIMLEIFCKIEKKIIMEVKYTPVSKFNDKEKLKEKLKDFQFYNVSEKRKEKYKDIEGRIHILNIEEHGLAQKKMIKNFEIKKFKLKKDSVELIDNYNFRAIIFKDENNVNIFYLTHKKKIKENEKLNYKKLDENTVNKLLISLFKNEKILIESFFEREEIGGILKNFNKDLLNNLIKEIKKSDISKYIDKLLESGLTHFEILKSFFENICEKNNMYLEYINFIIDELNKGLYCKDLFVKKIGECIYEGKKFEYKIDLDKNEVILEEIQGILKNREKEKILEKQINKNLKLFLKKGKVKAIYNNKEYYVLNLKTLSLEDKKVFIFQYIDNKNIRRKEIFLLTKKNDLQKKEDCTTYLLDSGEWIFYDKQNLYNEYNMKINLKNLNINPMSIRKYSCNSLVKTEKIYGVKIFFKEEAFKFKKDSNNDLKEKNNKLFLFFNKKSIFYFFIKIAI